MVAVPLERKDLENRILDVLVRAELITAEQQKEILDIQKGDKSKTVGAIAIEKGYVSQASLDAMLEAQSAERMAQVGEGKNSNIPLEKNEEGKVTGFKLTERGFTRSYIDTEPNGTLKSIQATEHLCALLNGAVQIKPELASDPRITNAMEALKNLGELAYKQASTDIEATNKPLSQNLSDLGNSIENSDMSRSKAVLALHDAVQIASIDMPKEFVELANTRLGQIDTGAGELIKEKIAQLNDGKAANDVQAFKSLMETVGLQEEAKKAGAFLTSGASADLARKFSELNKGGITANEIDDIRRLMQEAEKSFDTKDSGQGLTAKEKKELFSR